MRKWKPDACLYYSLSGGGGPGLASKSQTSRIHACISTSCGVRIDDSTMNGCSIICSGVGLFIKSLIMLSSSENKMVSKMGFVLFHANICGWILLSFFLSLPLSQKVPEGFGPGFIFRKRGDGLVDNIVQKFKRRQVAGKRIFELCNLHHRQS